MAGTTTIRTAAPSNTLPRAGWACCGSRFAGSVCNRTLGQPLDPAELSRIRQIVAWAARVGARIVLDTHNYGRYQLSLFGRPRSLVIDEKIDGSVAVSREHFADYWRRLAEAFAGNQAVVGLGLMNEPHDMGQSDWKAISQAAVDAVRTVNREAFVIVAGNGWSNAERFPEN